MDKDERERLEVERRMEEHLAPYKRNLELYGEIYPGAIRESIDVGRRLAQERNRKP